MATLNLRIDPRQMETGADRAENALEGVKREASQAQSAIDRMARTGGASTQRLGGAVRGMGARMQAARGQIQNTAFQLGDFATQVGAGTSASVALGQQLPQLLGGFGALGAVLGAVVAVGVPLAASFIDMGSSAEDTAAKIEDLNETVDRLADTTERASSAGVSDLIEKYGVLTSEVVALAAAQKELAYIQSSRELAELRRQMAAFTDVGWMDSLRGFADTAGGEIRKLQHEFDLTEEAATELKGSFDALSAADGPGQTASAYGRVRDLLIEAVGGAENLNEEQFEYIKNVTAAEAAAREMARAIDDGADALSLAQSLAASLKTATEGVAGAMSAVAGMNISGPFETALDAAVKLFNQAKQIAEIRSGPLSFGGSNLEGPSLVLDPKTGEYVTSGQTGITQQPGAGLPFITVPDAPSVSTAGGGGGGGGGATSRAADEAERLSEAYDSLLASLDPLEDASQQFATAQKTINEAQAAGIITAEEAARAYGMATEEYNKMVKDATEATSQFDDIASLTGSAFDRLFDSIASGGADASDVLRDLGQQLVALGLKMALAGIFPGVFGAGGTAPLSFDGGGYTGSGARSGGIDGKGGFPAILHPQETVVDHTKGGNTGGGSSVGLKMNFYGLEEKPEVRQNGDRIDIDFRKGLRSEVQNGALDGAMSRRYGLRPKAQGA